MENRKDRNMSEVRRFQDFRNERNILDVTDGNRRFKKYQKKENMTGLIQNSFGRILVERVNLIISIFLNKFF